MLNFSHSIDLTRLGGGHCLNIFFFTMGYWCIMPEKKVNNFNKIIIYFIYFLSICNINLCCRLAEIELEDTKFLHLALKIDCTWVFHGEICVLALEKMLAMYWRSWWFASANYTGYRRKKLNWQFDCKWRIGRSLL